MKETFFEIVEELSFDFGRDENELLQNLGFDSIKILEMIVLLEERLDIAFEDDELIPENFIQVKDLLGLIICKKGA
ncbi:MAG: hypothetical protein KAX49_05885 [Halanaerobiales bacterium]|nr:hypothetical protein [Halanaerobiales bacterium]